MYLILMLVVWLVTLGDLMDFIQEETVVIKIDIEGFECKVCKGSIEK